jgi:hypothetical protein
MWFSRSLTNTERNSLKTRMQGSPVKEGNVNR